MTASHLDQRAVASSVRWVEACCLMSALSASIEDESGTAEPRVYRNKAYPIAGVVACVLYLTFLGLLLADLIQMAHGGQAVRESLMVPVLILAALYWLRAGTRTRVTVRPGAESFEVANRLKSYEIRWRDVERFEAGATQFGSVVQVRLRDGKKIKCHALSGENPKSWGTTTGFLAEFNKLLAEQPISSRSASDAFAVTRPPILERLLKRPTDDASEQEKLRFVRRCVTLAFAVSWVVVLAIQSWPTWLLAALAAVAAAQVLWFVSMTRRIRHGDPD